VAELVEQWASLDKLQTRYEHYREKCGTGFQPVNSKANRQDACSTMNEAQHQLREAFDPFFAALHEGLKQLDKTVRQHEKQEAEKAQTNGKRTATDRKTRALKTAEERFPKAEYEDVTGLCKLASPVEVEEQEYSLNPGRYVGVVIEEDGKTEEEFVEDILATNDELLRLNKQAHELESVITHNVSVIAGEL